MRMSVFRCFFFVAQLAQAHVLQRDGGERAEIAPDPANEGTDSEAQRAPSLLLALSLASLVHVLLFWALTAHPGPKRGVDAASFPVELWPAFQARITEGTTPALVEPPNPAPLRLESTDADATIEQKASTSTQKNSAEPEKRVLEQQGDQERQEQREQKQGCLGPEEMARLEQARSSNTDSQTGVQAVGTGTPCVEG